MRKGLKDVKEGVAALREVNIEHSNGDKKGLVQYNNSHGVK